jgi:hypothetical protein
MFPYAVDALDIRSTAPAVVLELPWQELVAQLLARIV